MFRRDSAKKIAAALFLAAFFLAFTWRGILVYFSGDDVSNLYFAWKQPLGELVRSNLFFWSHHYRPFGGAIYRMMFAIFGFHPRPLDVLYYAVLLFNFWLAFAVFRKLSRSDEIALLATLLFSVHGCLGYLYYNTGVLYDVFCFTIFFAILVVYLGIRERGEYPGWRASAGLLLLFICCLNSKEMGAALPPILLLFELIFHRPQNMRPGALLHWLTHEARTGIVLSLLVIPYAVGKLARDGLANSPAYIPHVSGHAWLESTAQYLAYLVYSQRPFTVSEVFWFYGVLAVAALAMRSRLLLFGLLFFLIGLLPVSFVSTRLGFVLYLPLAGLALYAATLLVRAKDRLFALGSLRALAPYAGAVLFLLTAAGLGVAHARHWETPHDPSPVRMTVRQFSGRLPDVRPGMRLLFVKDPFGGSYELLYTLALLYRQRQLEVVQMDGRPPEEVARDLEHKYDHIYTYERGHYVEMGHTDTARSVRLHILIDGRNQPMGGSELVVGHPDQDAYFVSDVIVADASATDYWTSQSPQLKFLLHPVPQRSYYFKMRLYLPGVTFDKTGPVTIRYFVNDHLLDRVRYDSPEQHEFSKGVPNEWLSKDDFTLVRMEVENPYIAPSDGAKLGFLLQSAGFYQGY